jgi:Zn-dependent metalloprotease
MRNPGFVLAVAAILIASACSTGKTRASAEPALPPGATLTRDPVSGTVRFLKGQNISRELDGDPLFRAARNAGDAESVARAFLTAYAAVFRLDHPSEELTKRRIDVDGIGTTHVRFDQTYRGLPIPGAELIVHLDRERRVVLVNGTTIATPTGLDVTPALAANDARGIAARDAGLAADACAACAADLVVFAERGAKPRLAWRIAAPSGAIQGSERTIDAQDGTLLR